jgi:hypothetical protein
MQLAEKGLPAIVKENVAVSWTLVFSSVLLFLQPIICQYIYIN